MTVTNNNIPTIHRKEWQFMNPAPSASLAGSFVVTSGNEQDNLALLVLGATLHYMYHHDEDAWVQIPSGALAGTISAGACGTMSRWSNTLTATGGSTTTLTTTANITGLAIGRKIRFLTGANAGQEATISGVIINPAGTSTIQFSAVTGAVANTDTFAVDTGRFFIMNAGTIASGIFKSYDPLTGVWTTLGTTNLPATWGTDGRLVATPSYAQYLTGTSSGTNTSTTLNHTGKNWTANQWTNYQIRITAGTGIGQIRTIASNTTNQITVSSAWTVTPDATSQYEITGNDDFIYLLGNNAVTMYRYSISGATWTVMAPTTARAGAPVAGMSANWADKTGDANWALETDIKDGRYIYSFRGGATGTLDRFDIAGGTAGAGAWANIVYVNNAETFTTGSAYGIFGRYIFIRKDATHRYFKYSLRGNYLKPLSTNLYPDSTAVIGDKMWLKSYNENGVDKLVWLYSLRNTGTELHRLLLI